MATPVAAPSARRCGGSPAGRRTDASHWQGQRGRPCDPVWQGLGQVSSVGEPCQRMSGREVTPGRVQRRSGSACGGRRRPVAFAGARRVCTGGGGGPSEALVSSDLTPSTPALYAPAARLVPPPPALCGEERGGKERG